MQSNVTEKIVLQSRVCDLCGKDEQCLNAHSVASYAYFVFDD